MDGYQMWNSSSAQQSTFLRETQKTVLWRNMLSFQTFYRIHVS
jgi:hypothetical protein